ncbi:MAG: RnfH family protein [Pseudomonadota bacterium]
MLTIQIEVAYADQQNQIVIPLIVSESCCIEAAIQKSGILIQFPNINLAVNKVGIFSKIRPLNTILQSGDRIEIYRTLAIDPKKNRRTRAEKQKTKLSKQSESVQHHKLATDVN